MESQLESLEKSHQLKVTTLLPLHRSLMAQMVPFANYSMPLKYETTIINEHLHTRSTTGFFDVSHMGQADIYGGDVISALEKIIPIDLENLALGKIKYSQILNNDGGIVDDLMISRLNNINGQPCFRIIVNASCKDKDYQYIRSYLSPSASLIDRSDLSLISIQGPKCSDVLSRIIPEAIKMSFMTLKELNLEDKKIIVSRCGYTGEDGFEISIENNYVKKLAQRILEQKHTFPVGLGARDTLRLEAGLCLYGSDINEDISPVEANLSWSLSKKRIKKGNFLGSSRIINELETNPSKIRTGLRLLGKAIARPGMLVRSLDGLEIGKVTSGAYGPSIGCSIAVALISQKFSIINSKLLVEIRNKFVEAEVVQLPFVSHKYYRGG